MSIAFFRLGRGEQVRLSAGHQVDLELVAVNGTRPRVKWRSGTVEHTRPMYRSEWLCLGPRISIYVDHIVGEDVFFKAEAPAPFSVEEFGQ